MTTVAWDNQIDGYRPLDQLYIAESLELHTDRDEEIDPVTYEVLRHNLWNINEENGITIQRISGSPVAAYVNDFNSAILTETGDFVYMGPYILWFAGVLDLSTKWTLENRADDPGIRDGDMFLLTDPWIAGTHQMDAQLLCPVFVEGKLFCWTCNICHTYDLGGLHPGSFVPDAEDVFAEPLPMPPIRIVDRGKIRRDLEEVYTAQSRLPAMTSLDLRAQIAGNLSARRRVLELVERHGASTVKGVMDGIMDRSEASFMERLDSLPDGIWQQDVYMEQALEGDRGVYRALLTLEKDGDTLTFSNEGTDEQVGAINCTYAGWRAGILAALVPMFCYDQLNAIGGALRHLAFSPTRGVLTSASRPAAVTCASVGTVEVCTTLAKNCLGRLLAESERYSDDVMCVDALSTWPTHELSGIDQRGNPYGIGMTDPMNGAIGAFSSRDGMSNAGLSWLPRGLAPNIEFNEQSFPIVYLYRRRVVDSGGAGRYRGGNAAEYAITPHKTDTIRNTLASLGIAVPTGPGVFGGMPGAPNRYRLRRATNVWDWFAKQKIPGELDELEGEWQTANPKHTRLMTVPGDVFECRWCAGAGFGDPLERDPARVAADIGAGEVTAETAGELYGVVISSDGSVDGEGTARRRQEAYRGRCPDCEASSDHAESTSMSPIVTTRHEGTTWWACRRCGHRLTPTTRCFTDGCHVGESVPGVAGRWFGVDTAQYIDADVMMRQFACPHCARLLEMAIVVDERAVPAMMKRR